MFGNFEFDSQNENDFSIIHVFERNVVSTSVNNHIDVELNWSFLKICLTTLQFDDSQFFQVLLKSSKRNRLKIASV